MSAWGGRHRVAVLGVGLLLAACSASFKDPTNLPLVPDPARVVPAGLPNVGRDAIVALAFPGGGTRAAGFAHGVMQGLDRIRADSGGTYFDKVTFISGVSGGSIAAAYYGSAAGTDWTRAASLRVPR